MAITETIRLSKNTSAQWTSLNPILLDKEIGIETNTKLFKIGDGIQRWSNLPHVVSGGINALFIFLSTEADNLIGLDSDGGIYLSKETFNGVADYVAGKEQGPSAPTPGNEYNATVLRIGQDVFGILSQLATIANRVTQVEARPVAIVIDDTQEVNNKTWSSDKIVDHVLTSNIALKNELVNNADGAYDALERLAQLLLDNNSLAVVFAEELGTTVRFNIAQSLTSLQKAQARSNIDAVGVEDIGDTTDILDHYISNLILGQGSPFEESEL